MSLFVNRSDLYWALNAALPHVGSKNEGLDFVGMHFGEFYPELEVYATDKYTLGVATCQVKSDDLPLADFALPVKEAKELLRMVRPTLKRHELEPVELLYVNHGSADPENPPELHVALAEPEDNSERETAVFEVIPPGMDYDTVDRRLEAIMRADIESLSERPNLPFKPDFAARFAKAARHETDRLILSPRMIDGLEYGASYVTVGSHFEGAIAGMTYAPKTDESVPASDAPEWTQEENAA